MKKKATPPEACSYLFNVKGKGTVECDLKACHRSEYHERDFGFWKARHWPARRSYFTTKHGAHLPKEVI